MTEHVYNMNPRRIGEILQECIREIGGDEAVQDLIRKEKACKIADIFRGFKLAQLYHDVSRRAMADPVWAFDRLYDMDLHTLEAYSYALDKQNTAYMKEQLAKHNNPDNCGRY